MSDLVPRLRASKREARQLAESLGHRLSPFITERSDSVGDCADAYCYKLNCPNTAVVAFIRETGELVISGSAISETCLGTEQIDGREE